MNKIYKCDRSKRNYLKQIYLKMQIYAHPDEFLIKHLENVAKEIQKFGETPVEKFFLFLTGFFHDFGKATKFFQNKLANKKVENNILAEHSALGAFAYVYTLFQNWKEISANFKLTPIEFLKFVLAWFIAIYLHHQDLKNLDFDLPYLGLLGNTEADINNKLQLLVRQIDNLDKNFIEEFQRFLVKQNFVNLKFDINKFKTFILKESFKQILLRVRQFKEKWCNFAYFIKKFYSNLIFADKYKTIFKDLIEDYLYDELKTYTDKISVVNALEMIESDNFNDYLLSYADGFVDIYNSDLLDWLKNPDNYRVFEETILNYCNCDSFNLFKCIQFAQSIQIQDELLYYTDKLKMNLENEIEKGI